MPGNLGYREVFALTMDSLTKSPRGQYHDVVEDVLRGAEQKGLIASSQTSQERDQLYEHVQEAMWDCLLKRLIVFGSDRLNPSWPHYRVTEYGERALKNTAPQPYDPDGFMDHFDTACAGVDSVVRAYVEESVRAFKLT
jgi:CO dehydrogenase/acetyl-CoA synthase delta subunit